MGKKGWFASVKKALNQKNSKKKGWFGKNKNQESDHSQPETSNAPPAVQAAPPVPPVSAAPKQKVVKFVEAENEQQRHAYSVAIATAMAAEAAVAAAQAAAEVVRLTNVPLPNIPFISSKSKEESSAIKIQKTFRGYKARKSTRALKGLSRLKSLVEGHAVKRQATTTLRCMQTMSRVQTQIRDRRSRMSEQNLALQRQLMQKHEKELEKTRTSVVEDWDNRKHSKEQVDQKLNYRNDAATRRERALAYSYTHQQTWRTSPRSADHTFMDPNNPHWGWSWLERWMAARPWEGQELKTKSQTTREPNLVSPTTPRTPTQTRRSSISGPTPKSPTSAPGKIARPISSPRKSVTNMDDDAKSTKSTSSFTPRLKTKNPSPLGLDKSKSVTTGKETTAKKRLSFSSPPGASSTRRYSVDAKTLH